jgi:hypothetical protein
MDIKRLNAETVNERLAAILEIKRLLDVGAITQPVQEGYTNNHVHTRYSFSPYSPADAVWEAYNSGLCTVGIVDHDTISGAQEFIEAGKILGIATTVGFEIRTDWRKTQLNGKRINNPDQISNAYICAHGIPHTQFEKADAFLRVVRNARDKRNRAMVNLLNGIIRTYEIEIDYDGDVLPISYSRFGGAVTERHLMFVLVEKIIEQYGKGELLIDFIENELNIQLNRKQHGYLTESKNSYYEYDLLNILKSSFIPRIYIDAQNSETPEVSDAVAFIKELGAIPTYCYLGNVKASPTGDKKEQRFEDDYLEELFAECKKIGFQAIAYMPSRNTLEQIECVMRLCVKYGFMQISGEDINQPRQSFVCKQLKDPLFSHLKDTTWALVGHEIATTENIKNGMFAENLSIDPKQMQKLIQQYKKIALI